MMYLLHFYHYKYVTNINFLIIMHFIKIVNYIIGLINLNYLNNFLRCLKYN
jgi:hypothetical protein